MDTRLLGVVGALLGVEDKAALGVDGRLVSGLGEEVEAKVVLENLEGVLGVGIRDRGVETDMGCRVKSKKSKHETVTDFFCAEPA